MSLGGIRQQLWAVFVGHGDSAISRSQQRQRYVSKLAYAVERCWACWLTSLIGLSTLLVVWVLWRGQKLQL
jgi:hypothetical protein